ncbi:MAG: ATP-binding protein [Victivallales bacterium]
MANPKTNKFISAASIYIIGVLAVSAFLFLKREHTLLGIYDKINQSAASCIPLILDPAFQDRVAAGKINEAENIENSKKLTMLAEKIGAAYIYTIIKKDGKLYITASNYPPSKDNKLTQVNYFMKEYKTAPDALKKLFAQKKTVFSEYSDGWGFFRSVYIPMYTPDGMLFAACADMKMKEIYSGLYPIVIQSVLLAVFFFLLAYPMIWAFNDISESQKGELIEKKKQLAHAGRLTAMGEMAAGIAHEINQPLCVIRGYLELLKAMLKDNSEVKEKQMDSAFDIGISSVEKISRIVNHMRSFSRMKAQELKPVDLKDPVDSALSFFNEQIKLHNISLIKNYEENVPFVNVDAQRFEQIAVNLVSNARYAVDKMGELKGRSFVKKIEVSIRHDRKNSKVCFEISDNGIGMTRNVIERCREPFFTTKGVDEGTGLGLSISEEIVKGFRGELYIKSKPDAGSTFTVLLPVREEDNGGKDTA